MMITMHKKSAKSIVPILNDSFSRFSRKLDKWNCDVLGLGSSIFLSSAKMCRDEWESRVILCRQLRFFEGRQIAERDILPEVPFVSDAPTHPVTLDALAYVSNLTDTFELLEGLNQRIQRTQSTLMDAHKKIPDSTKFLQQAKDNIRSKPAERDSAFAKLERKKMRLSIAGTAVSEFRFDATVCSYCRTRLPRYRARKNFMKSPSLNQNYLGKLNEMVLLQRGDVSGRVSNRASKPSGGNRKTVPFWERI